MDALALAGAGLVASEPVYLMVLKMSLTTTPRGRKASNLMPEHA
jgi:uncharacterized membrane protein